MKLGDKVLVGRVGGRGFGEEVEDGGAAETGVGGVASLGDKVLDHVVEGAEVVGVRLAELEEVERGAGAEGRFEVDLRRERW